MSRRVGPSSKAEKSAGCTPGRPASANAAAAPGRDFSFLELLPVPAIVVEEGTLCVRLANAAAHELYPDPPSLSATKCLDLLRAGDRASFEKWLRDGDGSPAPFHILAETPTRVPVELTATRLPEGGTFLFLLRDLRAQQEAEQALRFSEDRYRRAYQRNLAGIFRTTLDGQFLDCNPALARMFGYASTDEVLRARAGDFYMDPADRARAVAGARDGQAHSYELLLKKRNGSPMWAMANFSLVEERAGEPAVLYGTVIDITAHKHGEKLQSALYAIADKATAAEDLEAFYAAIHRIVGELLYANNFYIALLNEEATALHFVYGVDEVDRLPAPEVQFPRGRGCTEFVMRTGQTQRISDQRFAELCAAGEVEDLGAPSIDWLGAPLKSGNRVVGAIVVQSYTAAIRFHEGDPEILTFVSQHVAAAIDRKRNLDALRESEARYRSLVDSAVYGIFRASTGGRFLSVNPALVNILGYANREEVLALDLGRDVYADGDERKRILDEVLRTGEVRATEARWKRKDGEHITVRLSGRPRRDAQGNIDSFELIAEDITERRALEDQLRQAQKMEAVGRLAGGLSHDFNNLLTVIKGYSELMINELNPNDPLRSEAREIHRAAERAASLTKQLLAFSRQQVMAPRVLNLNQVVGNVEQMVRRLIGEDVELFTALHADLGHVRADPGQIEQVIMNLAVNARDAMPRGGNLTIETGNATLDESYAREHVGARAGEFVMLAVADTGDGMPPEVQSRIFEPFFTTKEMGKGTGLGLSTVYGIVKQSQGYIWVYSEVGVGTTFKMYLPRVDAEAEALPTAKIPAYAQHRGEETILLVEDEDGVRALIRQVLQKNGYTVLEARHGGEALLICERHPGEIQLLLTDVVLEQMGGRELATRLAAERPEMKILFMSGYTDEAIVKHGVLEPGTSFLQKPFTTEALARKVRSVLDGAAEE